MKAPSPRSANSDTESIDSIVSAAYAAISGRAGEERDWERMRSLFAPGARLIPTTRQAGHAIPDGETPQPLDVDTYIVRVRDFFATTGFFETEVARRTEQFGRIAHAFSTYESRRDPADPEPFMRGINSIQLYHDGHRWWIVNIFWQHEHPDSRVPEKYLT